MSTNLPKATTQKWLLYGFAGLCALIAGWGIWRSSASQNPPGSASAATSAVSRQQKVPTGGPEAVPGTPAQVVPPEAVMGVLQGPERNRTPTVKLSLVPAKAASFVAKTEPPAPDFKLWDKAREHYLIESEGWYDLHDQHGRKLFRLPNYINVDVAGSPDAVDTSEREIQWRWAGDSKIIGVQQIVHRKPQQIVRKREGESTEMTPDAARIYMLDIKQLDTVYELVPPVLPQGLVVYLEGVSDTGGVSLAAVSPEAYDRLIDLKGDPKHYQHMGVYEPLQ